MKKAFYICQKVTGINPCEYALQGKKFLPSEVEIVVGQNPVCPNPKCGEKLERIEIRGFNWRKATMIGGGALVLVGLVFGVMQIFSDPRDPSNDKERPVSVIPGPSGNPWNVYEKLEESSTILLPKR